ncbi:DUF4345 domain-containing protein [Chryseobacterium phocaeense]|uniref:DUF4345 domain-containing protein n=1 Tax=Chryseobacterium phocaeense TaxID=1816690 RepID=UPI0009BBBACC|nr:DUF4345 domain-containing protein [Chryseobacterium phocaeense]
MSKLNPNERNQNLILLISAIGLIPIALSYGLFPNKTLTTMYGFSVDNINLTHIMRAVMGLYFGQIIFWLIGIKNTSLKLPAMYSLVVFMGGLVIGRLLSIVLDGIPHWMLLVYLFLELSITIIGTFLILKKTHN